MMIARLLLTALLLIGAQTACAANIPGGGTGTGPNVAVTDNQDGTVTMSNGIVSIVIVKNTGRLNSVAYTYDCEGTRTTSETLSGKGQYYYGGFMLGRGTTRRWYCAASFSNEACSFRLFPATAIN
ncbi:MAG TPA: hypothetical protein VGP72_29940 [Planctomycetota bacterium]|jgi:hypothetical protein